MNRSRLVARLATLVSLGPAVGSCGPDAPTTPPTPSAAVVQATPGVQANAGGVTKDVWGAWDARAFGGHPDSFLDALYALAAPLNHESSQSAASSLLKRGKSALIERHDGASLVSLFVLW